MNQNLNQKISNFQVDWELNYSLPYWWRVLY